jgi:hypothetical protein
VASALLARLRGDGFTVTRDGDSILVVPRDRLTDAYRQTIRDHKAELLAELRAESADPQRQELLRMLNARPGIQRAYLAEATADGGGRVTIALRDVGMCQLIIPEGRFDPGGIVKLLDDVAANEKAAN